MKTLYNSYKLNTVEALNELNKQAYNAYLTTFNLLQEEAKRLEDKFKLDREERRKLVEYHYTISCNVAGWYTLTREVLNPLDGDDSFNKTIAYCPFKIVNGVLISEGSGYLLPLRNGTILDPADITLLEQLCVPEIFKQKPA